MSLEIFYHAIKDQIGCKFYAAVASVHFSLITSGFKCIGLGEKLSSAMSEGPLTDMLPKDWNSNKRKCVITYWNTKAKFFMLLKIFNMETFALAHIMREAGSSITDLDIVYEFFFGDDMSTFNGLYTRPEELLSLIKEKLLQPSLNFSDKSAQTYREKEMKTATQTHSDVSFASSDNFYIPSGREILRSVSSDIETCPNCRARNAIDDDPMDLFLPSGRCDLDPLGRGCCGRGGMTFDPLRNFCPPRRPRVNDPTRIPPGSVPPGARFDPISPSFGSRRTMEPDPDEMRPPGFGERFF